MGSKRMPNTARFLKSARKAKLIEHINRLGIDHDLTETSNAESFEAVLQFPSTLQDRLAADADRIMAMSDEIGQAAMLNMPHWRTALLEIEGAVARAHWLFLQSEDAFRHAEEIRYADENQNAMRMWTAFVGPASKQLKVDEANRELLAKTFRQTFGVERVCIDVIERLQRGSVDGRTSLQLTVYSEDEPVDDLEFVGPALRNRSRRPVRETAIVYEADTGIIEVVSRNKDLRLTIATLFAQQCLGAELSGETLPLLSIDLAPLVEPHAFPTRTEDGIAKVKLTMLTLSSSDQRLTQQFAVKFSDPAILQDVLRDHYGSDGSPLEGDLYPWRARIEVQFEPEQGRKRGKKLSLELTRPNRCSLRGKTERERMILDRYLRDWGLRADEAA